MTPAASGTKLTLETPKAWGGYAHDSKTGEFKIKVCFSCPDAARAMEEARPLKTVEYLCTECYGRQMLLRLGEKQESLRESTNWRS